MHVQKPTTTKKVSVAAPPKKVDASDSSSDSESEDSESEGEKVCLSWTFLEQFFIELYSDMCGLKCLYFLILIR